ncbi:MAG: DNA-processing protein DprA [Candidatus Rokubacteria bacterium]|nr:DNA-processing protein DprA [Candidatus Rokubacteria bacterium]
MRRGRAPDVRAVGPHDADYPVHLRDDPLAPPVLYLRGGLVREDALAVAIVGSRTPSPYGVEMAQGLAAELARRGVTIVSGLARGIDSAAHRGALDAGGRTIAVFGSGIDVIYPPEHRRLAARIATAGALLSQFAPGTPPFPHHFPLRNRVIAAMALAVVVVEAAERSGSLITAGLAAELGREVLAVPGRVTSRESRGTLRLIKDGAALVEDAEDVVAALPSAWRDCVRPAAPRPAPAPAARGERGQVEQAIGEDPVTIDDVIARSGLPSGRAVALLLDLELGGRVRQLPGKRFVRVSGP